MLIWECSISQWRTKVLCYFHFSRISSDGRGVSVVTIHYLTRFDDSHLSEATIKTDKDGDAKTYITDILWYHLFMKKIAGTSKSKFENLFKLTKVVFSIVPSNAEEESLFSWVRKNLTSQRASPQLDGSLSSILPFQLKRPHGQPCYKYNPSASVIEKAKTATWEYNKAHSSRTK